MTSAGPAPPAPLALRVASRAFAGIVRAVPEHRRLGTAAGLASLATWVLSHTRAAGRVVPHGYVDTPATVLLWKLLHRINAAGERFSLPIHVENEGEFRAALAEGRGMLAVGPTSSLNPLLVRYMHERHAEPLVVARKATYRLVGTTQALQALQTTPAFMVRVRSALAAGRVVMANLDREEGGRGTVAFQTDRGTVVTADPLIRLAARWNARLCFAAIHLDRGSVRITFEIPPATEPRSPDADTAAYAAFLQRFIAARAAPPGRGPAA